MNNQTVWVTIGLIGSGKSTWAWTKTTSNSKTVSVSKDHIREMLHGGEYIFDEQLEPLVNEINRISIIEALHAGMNVVIDECHLTKQSRVEIINNIGEEFPEINIIGVVFRPEPLCKNLERRIKEPKVIADPCKSAYMWRRVNHRMCSIIESPDINEGFDSLIDDWGDPFITESPTEELK